MSKINLPKFLFINGPTGSGKTTLTSALHHRDPTICVEGFARPIREMIYSVFFPEEGPVNYEINLKDGPTKAKEFPFAATTNLAPGKIVTFRDVMISFSEDWMKPRFGSDIFGRLALQRCLEVELYYDHFIFDGAAFVPEMMHIIKMADPSACGLIRLYRDGHDFAGDSRGYIELPCKSLDLHNSDTPEFMLDSLAAAWGNL